MQANARVSQRRKQQLAEHAKKLNMTNEDTLNVQSLEYPAISK
jgi:hypothetical protein